MGGSTMTGDGSIKDYLEYVADFSVSKYPIITIDKKSGSDIEYVELRESGDVIHISGRDVSLVYLLKEVDIEGVSYASQLVRNMLDGKELSFSIGSEGVKTGEITLDNNHILEIGQYQRNLQYTGKLVRV